MVSLALISQLLASGKAAAAVTDGGLFKMSGKQAALAALLPEFASPVSAKTSKASATADQSFTAKVTKSLKVSLEASEKGKTQESSILTFEATTTKTLSSQKTTSPGKGKKPVPAPVEDEVTPAPAPVEPTPVVTEPAPAPVEPTPVVTEPAPAPVEPTPVVTEPAPAPVESIPTTPEPLPVTDTTTPQAPTDGPVIQTSMATQAMTGRVATIQLDLAPGATVQVTGQPAYGRVTVNPDNSLALVLTGETSVDDLLFSVEIRHANGTLEQQEIAVDVTEGLQAGGWGLGDYYMLETGSDGRVVVEHGEIHREVYISGNAAALSAADIAAREGVSVESVTTKFLMDRPHYGASADLALDEAMGMKLWNALTDNQNTSHWLLFERGYTYSPGRVVQDDADGESELHPLYVTAYGSGADPIFATEVKLIKMSCENVVFQGIEFAGGFTALVGSNLLIDDVQLSGTNGVDVQNVLGFTMRNTEVLDIIRDGTYDGSDYWSPKSNRTSGVYVENTKGLLIENVLIDHSGWAEGYDYNLSATSGGQPPSMYSHNFYLQGTNSDITFRDNISLRPASDGVQVRSGGLVEDNIFIDGNASLFTGATNNYSLVTGNVVTSGAHKTVSAGQGALTQGIVNNGYLTTLLDNLVTHMADPNNPAEIAAKTITHNALNSAPPLYYNDTIVHNWGKQANLNTAGLDTSLLNATTIQKFAALVTGKSTATIEDLAQHLRANSDDRIDGTLDADTIIAYFREAFGIDLAETDAGSARFVPSDLGEGMRWDNRLNWDTGVLPTEGQDIDLGNNKVYYSGTTTIGDLKLGSYGELVVNNGRLNVGGDVLTEGSGARLMIDKAGQVWVDGYSDANLLNISVAGGRFANVGDVDGAIRMDVSDNGQVIFATGGANFDLRAGSQIMLHGDDIRVGFDGASSGNAVLRLNQDSALGFDAGDDGRMGRISEFVSGAFGNSPNVQSGVNLGSAQLYLDLNGMVAGSHVLIAVDEIMGSFGGFSAAGLGSARDATILVDYTADQVVLQLGAEGAGSGRLDLVTNGNQSDFATTNAALWQALTDGHGSYAQPSTTEAALAWDWI
ncbi:right-handed parallel beta-helix repeat-containing protein [Cereibacter ovatus]|nr:right-handed parallel beta-helix repeat-containing protein [Cereibacter ovatus]